MRLYTLDEVATLLQVSKEMVSRLVKAGQLPASKVGRAWRFAAGDIEHFLSPQGHSVSPTQSAACTADGMPRTEKVDAADSLEQPGSIRQELAPFAKRKNELGNFFTRRLRILLAEDNVINQRLTRALLEKYGHEVVVVENGRDAVEQIKAHGFDVVLMDIQMPIMTGVEATKAIRCLPQHSNIPIIAVTSNIQEGDRERFLAEGLDDYVPKPIRRSDLLSSIKRATSVLCNVLIVEDNAGDFELAKHELLNGRRYGIRFGDVTWAQSIAEAERMIAERSPDVILLDSSLPDASGLTGLERIKSTGCLAPVLLLTGMSDDEVAIAALHAGAQDYLVKGQAGDLHRAIRYALERAETQTELIEAKKDALSANAAKGAFLANMSHEIRTPLTAIIGFSEALVENALSEEESIKSARAVLRNGRYLLEIINDILDFSKIEAGKVDVELLDFSPLGLVKEVTDIMRLKALDRGIELKTSCEFPLPKTIHSDPMRIKQILLNLIGNAVKFTTHGQVRVELSADIVGERLFVKVSDTGIGMSDEQIGRLFQPFTQADASTTRRFGGTGLGLTISKELAELLEGAISVESTAGKGSTFTLTVPLGRIAHEDLLHEMAETTEEQRPAVSAPEETVRLAGRVLVAEDSEDNRGLLQHLLSKAGVEYEFAENGAQAVQKALQGTFNLILMDMQMPIMDGYTATRKITATTCKTPIVALTASTLKSRKDQCFEAGCVEYMTKPFAQREFFALLSRYLSSCAPRNSAHPPFESKLERPIAALAELNKTYAMKLPQKIAAITTALDQSDWPALAKLAHGLAGAGMFDLYEVGDLAKALEASALKQNEAQCSTLVHQLDHLAQNITPAEPKGSDLSRPH